MDVIFVAIFLGSEPLVFVGLTIYALAFDRSSDSGPPVMAAISQMAAILGVALAVTAVWMLLHPWGDLYHRRRTNEISVDEARRRRVRIRAFYGSLAASVLVFAMIAAVNAGLAEA